MHLVSRSIVALALAVATIACDNTDIFDVPTGPTPDPVTEIFSGTLTPNGGQTHPFGAQVGGTVTATLVTLSPETVVGLAIGTWNGAACQLTIVQNAALQGTVLIGTAAAIGNYCVHIYDAAGTLAGPTSYELRVVRP